MTDEVKVLSDDALREIEARANAATEGPWSAYHRISPRGAYKQWHIGNKEGSCQITMHGHQRDYEFMAHAREDIPALCATVRALRDELNVADDALENQSTWLADLRTQNTALREQLVQMRTENTALRDDLKYRHEALEELRRHRDRWLTALNPPTGYESVDDAIRLLQSQLAQVTQENERLASQLKEWQEEKDTKAGYL